MVLYYSCHLHGQKTEAQTAYSDIPSVSGAFISRSEKLYLLSTYNIILTLSLTQFITCDRMETADMIELSGSTSRKEDNIMATPDLLFPADAEASAAPHRH